MSQTPSNPNRAFGIGRYAEGRYGNAPISNLPIGYYLSLPTSQYQNSTNFLASLNAVLQKLDDATFCLSSFITAFDLDFAEGVQLDYLGRIIGQSRTVAFQPANSVSPVLSDDTYRLLLKARIAQNQWDGNIDSLQGIWQSLFPSGRLIIDDQQNMSVTVIVSGSFNSIIKDLILNGYIVPRPQTVLYNVVLGQLPLFGVDEDNSFISGVDKGHLA